MKKFLSVIILIFLTISCSSKKGDDPLIIPPNFAEMPDKNKPEQPTPEQKEENVVRLKELLLKSDE